jgi:hypothetical protein
MLKPRSPQKSFYGSYLYHKIVPADPPAQTNQPCGRSRVRYGTGFFFVNELLKDRYTPDFGRSAENCEFIL